MAPPITPPMMLNWPFPPMVLLTAEVMYFLIVAGLSLAIFYRTRDIYSLSKHRGVFHFRNIFLYFSMAYFFILFIISVQLYSWFPYSRIPLVNQGILLLFGYFSTMAILSIGATVLIRNIKVGNTHFNGFLHVAAILISVLTFITASPEIMVMIQLLIMLGSFLAVLLRRRTKRKLPSMTQNRITYLLLMVFWIASVLALSRGFFFIIKVGLYAISSLIFLWIYLRVKKRLDDAEKKK